MEYKSIVLSGLPVSGKSTLASRLSETYTWPVHSIGQLFRSKWKELYPDGKVSFEEYWRNTTLEENLVVNRRMRGLVEKGNIIGDTRYSIYCTDLPALLVFVTAALDVRARRGLNTDRYRDKPLEEVRQILLEREGDEVRMGQKLFGTEYDYRDSQHYHLTLNSGLLTVEQEISIVTSIISTPE
ncbi:MAG: hypothetical protein HYS80_01935 [Candidatus Aenigmarchaeota archaeon]|nr:hypothetical protein [Candidatus Aenigmarchaeota archaeon]